MTFREFADRWMAQRHDLRPRTVELYRSLLRVHILPGFGPLSLGKLVPQTIRGCTATHDGSFGDTGMG